MDGSFSSDLGIFTSTPRKGDYDFWEPFYIGTNNEPYFDERVPYEGGYNKMVQAYFMCMQDYEYAILNNAFLIHHPGIRTFRKPQPQRNITLYMLLAASPHYDRLFGANIACSLFYTNHKLRGF